MDLNAVLAKIKQHPEIDRAGMIAFHYGLVRGHELDGPPDGRPGSGP